MGQKRKRHTDEFKARVAVEALRGIKTLGELSSVHHVHPTVTSQWRRKLLDGASSLFARAGVGGGGRTEEEMTRPLFEEIGRLKVELDWLREKL